MANITVDFSQYTIDTNLSGPYSAGDSVTLLDDSSILNALTTTQIDALSTNNVDIISSSDGVLSWNAGQFLHLTSGTVNIDPDTFAILADTGANIAALTASQIAAIAAEGVGAVNPTDSTLTLAVDQFNALGAMSVDASADFTIADTGANLGALSAGAIAALDDLGVNKLNATDNVLSLTVAQYAALGTVTLTGGDVVTLADTGANLNALTLSDYTSLGTNGIDKIDATDNAFNISLAEFNALGSVTLTAADVVTLLDSGATIGGLSTGNIASLATAGIDIFNATDNVLALTVAQYNQTITSSIALTGTDVVTLADTGGNLAALTTGQIDALVNIDAFDSTTGALTISVAQYTHINSASIALAVGDTVTISDTAANLGGLTFSTLGGKNVDFLDATTAFATLTVANLTDLGTVAFTTGSSVTLTDTGTNIAGVSDFSTFASHGVDTLDASDNTLTISAAKFTALGTTTLTAGDAVTISDTAAAIGALTFSALAGKNVDFLAATTAISVTVQNIADLGATHFTSGSAVTLADTGANIAAVSDFTTFGTHGVDTIDVSGANLLTINTTQLGGLGSVTLTAADTVTVSDTGANLATFGFGNFAGLNVDFINATDGATITVANVNQLGATVFTSASSVTVADTAVNIQAVSDFTTFATHGVDTIDSSDNTLSLTVAQFSGLGTTHLAGADAVTLADTASNLNTYLDSGDASTGLLANGVDTIHATGGSITINAAMMTHVAGTGAVFASGDAVTLSDTGAHIAALNFAFLPALNIDTIDATDALSISLAQYGAIAGTVGLTAGDDVTVTGNLDSLTTIQIGAIGSNNVDHLVGDDGSNNLNWTVAQWNALATAVTVSTTGSSFVKDTAANIAAATATQIGTFVTEGAEIWSATDAGTVSWTVAKLLAMGSSTFTSGSNTLISDSAANLQAVSDFSIFASHGIDRIDSTDNTLSISLAQFGGLGATTLTGADVVTVADSQANLEAAASTVYGAIGAAGVDFIHSNSGSLTITFADLVAIFSSGTKFTAADTVTMTSTQVDLFDSQSSAFLTVLGTNFNIDRISIIGGTASLDIGDWDGLVAGSVSIDAANTITLLDTAANLAGENAAAIAAMNGQIDSWKVSDASTLSLAKTQLDALATATITLASADTIQFSDAEATIEGLSAGQITSYITQGVDSFHASNTSILNMTKAQVAAVLATAATFATGDDVSLLDTGANIATLSAAQFGQLAAAGVDKVDASDNVLSLSKAQFDALGTVNLKAGDTVTLLDTGANLAALTFGTLASKQIDILDASDNQLTLNVAKFNALGTVALTALDTVTIADTAAKITTLDFSTLAGKNIDVLDVSSPFSLDVARYLTMGAVRFAAGDTITIADTGANIAALTSVQIGQLAANGIDKLDASDNVLSLTAAQYGALGAVALTASDVVTLLDTGANLAGLNFATLASNGVDVLNASDNVLSLTVAKYQALGAVALTAGDVVTLADAGANIAGLTAAQIGALAAGGIDKIDATNNALSLSVAQFNALGTVALTSADSITLLDTGTNLQTVDFSTLASKGIDIIDATDNALSLTAAQFQSLGTVALKSTDTVTLIDTGANISGLTVGNFNTLAAKGIDILDASDNAYNLTAAKVNGLGVLSLAANDTVTLRDSQANIEALTGTQIANAITKGIDIFDSTNSTLNLTASQISAVLGTSATFASSDTVTLRDTGANIAALTAIKFSQLAAAGVDAIDASDNTLTIDLDRYTALGTVALTQADTVTLQNDNNGLTAMTTAQILGLAASGIDVLKSTNTNFTFSAAQAHALVNQTGGGHVSLDATDTLFVGDTAANIGGLSASDIAALGAEGAGAVDLIVSSGTLTINLAYYNAAVAANVTIDNANSVTLADTGANLKALTVAQITALAGKGIDNIDATDNALSLTAAKLSALGAVSLTAADTVTLSDTAANIQGLTAGQITAYITQGVDRFDSTTANALSMTKAQVAAVLSTSASFVAGDTVTLADTGANIAALTPTQFGLLASHGVDVIDASTALSLSVAQYSALGTVTLTLADTVTIADTGANINGLTAAQIQGLAQGGIDKLDASNNTLTLSAAQGHALVNQTGGGTVLLAATDAVTLQDTGANISGLSASDLAALSTLALGEASLTIVVGGAYSLSVDQYNAVSANGTLLSTSDTIALTGTGGQLAAFLTPSAITTLNTDHIDSVDSTGPLSLTKVQIDNLATAGVALTQDDTVTMTDFTNAVTAGQITTYIAQGVDVFGSGSLTITVDQAKALVAGEASLGGASNLISDTGAHIQTLSAAEWEVLVDAGIGTVNNTAGPALLGVAEYEAFFGTGLLLTGVSNTLSDTGADIATLSTAQLAGLKGDYHFNLVDATDNTLSLTEAQTAAFIGNSGLSLGTNDTFTVLDTGANIALLTAANLTSLAGRGAAHVILDANDNQLTLTAAQYSAAGTGGIELTAADTVTLADTGANLATLTAGQIAAFVNVDALHATDNAVSFSIAQLNALATANVALTGADTVTLIDTQANVEALSAAQLTAYAAQGVDFFDPPSGSLNMNVSQVAAVVNSAAAFTASEDVTLVDTGANIAALTLSQFGKLALRGVDHIDATNNVLSLTAAKYSALGSTTLTSADAVTISDTGAHIAALTSTQFAALGTNGVDVIDASDNTLALSLAQFNGLGSVALTSTDSVSLKDTGANLAALSAGQLGALAAANIDRLDASDNQLSLSLTQYQALGSVVLTGSDVVTLTGTGASIAALSASQIQGLVAAGIDKIDASDDILSLTVDQYLALAPATLASGDNVTLTDTGANIASLSVSRFGALKGAGIDEINPTSNAVLSLAKYNALGAVTIAASATVTVNGTGSTDLIQGSSQSAHLILNGLGGDDVVFGGKGEDTLSGGDGSDTLNGGGGRDVLNGGIGNDSINGGNGLDTVDYSDASSGVVVDLENGTATGGAGTDLLSNIESATGSNFNDQLYGGTGTTVLIGGGGDDLLLGCTGADTLTGGTGADHFVYEATSDSTTGSIDSITDFSHADGDKIDVSLIDAIAGGADDPFTFVAGFTHHAGELMVAGSGGNYQVRADVDGNGVADLIINVHSITALTSGDFLL